MNHTPDMGPVENLPRSRSDSFDAEMFSAAPAYAMAKLAAQELLTARAYAMAWALVEDEDKNIVLEVLRQQGHGWVAETIAKAEGKK